MRFLTVFTSLVLVVCLACSFVPTKEECDVYDQVVRLHVIADSDSEEDQRIKLGVRDATLDLVSSITEKAKSAGEAETLLQNHLGTIRDRAKAYLSEIACDDEVDVLLTRENYPTRSYEDVTLPAGEYASLQIRIGEAAGHNWWCVLFPQVCTGTAGARYEMAKTGFTPDQIRILTESESPRYQIKFKLLEILSGNGSR